MMRRQLIGQLTALSVFVMLYLCLGFTSGRTIEKINSNASSDNLLGSVEGEELLDLNMTSTPEPITALYGNQSEMKSINSGTSLLQKRKAVSDTRLRWPNKRIPYKINPEFNRNNVKEINAAIAEWSQYTCLSFPRAIDSDPRYVYFTNAAGCWSYIGWVHMRMQDIGLAPNCRYKYVIIHEMGHAVGFRHEQERMDRDDFVIIRYENLIAAAVGSFGKKSSTTYGIPYDYKSAMHYYGNIYSKNGKNTIETKDPAFQNIIGRGTGLSFYDIKMANLMYSCSDQCPYRSVCPTQGFLGKDCKCWCPGNPVSDCYPLCVPACYYLRYLRGLPAYCNSTDTSLLSKTCREKCGHCTA